MDQSASVFSERGSALFVSFTPTLTARPVQFPPTNPELTFLIAQSFVTSDKVVTAPIHYNLRVVECSLAAAFLNAKLNPPGTQLPHDASPLGISLHGFHETYFSINDRGKDKSVAHQLEELCALTAQTLTQADGYTREEIAEVLGISVDELHARFTQRIPVRAERFNLRARALHVFNEALRVLKFMALLEEGPSSSGRNNNENENDTSAYNARLGALLNESQASCRHAYECSCPELDALCDIALAAGSYGSRLTGAGWGGCSVHLVPADRVEEVKAAWEREYYSKLTGLTEEQRKGAVVVSRPGTGSVVVLVEEGGRL
jgi:galactokinase